MGNIKNKISEEFRTLKVHFRFAIVGYHDVTDETQFDVTDEKRFEIRSFTETVEDVSAFLDHRLVATGGNDIPEDVLCALDRCLNLPDWDKQTNGRIIILITDAPGHGRELHDDDINDDHPNGFGSQTMKMICDRLQMKDAEINLMFCTLNPQATLKMQQAFESHYRQIMGEDIDKAFKVVNLIDQNQLKTDSSFHFVFVLDDSESMKGQPWNELLQAYNTFLNRRNNDQGITDIISVVQFSTTARTAYKLKPLPEAMSLPVQFEGQNTFYHLGLNLAKEVIDQDKTSSSVIMIFMSDGEDNGIKSGHNPIEIMKELYRKICEEYKDKRQFKCHTVGFGAKMQPEEGPRKLLEEIAKEGGGKMHLALTGFELEQVFGEIAQGCTIVSDTLVKRFVEILGDAITMKVLMDYL